jgi:formylglycine-generating enzyme required for sulfatase activity
VGGDLPSESQWMYVATSQGKDIEYPWGNEPDLSCDLAVISKKKYKFACGRNRSWEVCSKMLGNTQQGVCDMLGNVREWVLDEVDKYHFKRHQIEKTKLPTFPNDGSPICQNQTCDTSGKTHIERGGDFEGQESGSYRLNNHTFHIGIPNHNTNGYRSKEGFRIVRVVDSNAEPND